MNPDLEQNLGHGSEEVLSATIPSTERGSGRFHWRGGLIRLGVVIGAMALGGLAGAEAAGFLAYTWTIEMGGQLMEMGNTFTARGAIVAASSALGTLFGMVGGMEVGIRLTGGRTRS